MAPAAFADSIVFFDENRQDVAFGISHQYIEPGPWSDFLTTTLAGPGSLRGLAGYEYLGQFRGRKRILGVGEDGVLLLRRLGPPRGELLYAHGGFVTRALAVQWAELERAAFTRDV